MRPIDRGSCPVDSQGNPVIFSVYRDAKSDLLCRIGEYCSYCERRGINLDIEHVVPKIHQPDLENEWTNLLLSCKNCNSRKGDNNISRDGYLWPDQDDTETAFEYSSNGIVRVSGELCGERRDQAQRLLELIGLNHFPRRNHGIVPRTKDLRWLDRKKAWQKAEIIRNRFENGHVDIETIVMFAKENGFWSVWMTVFNGVPDVRRLLRRAFAGTRG